MRVRLVLLMAMVVALACGPPRRFTNLVGMEFVRIDPGSYKIGSADEGSVVEITLARGFYLQTTEVTQAQWQALMGNNPSHFQGLDRPVEMISRADIQEFLRKLNAREKDTRYRLPEVAEWDYACLAGGREPDEAPNLGEVAWWEWNSGGRTHPVGQKKPNAWGVYDMRGNVWEWAGPSSVERAISPQEPQSALHQVRGGSWRDGSGGSFRCTAGLNAGPEHRSAVDGFRCARTY
jgi:formylglycine-generating enzyme required for sulfatase activity